MSAKSKKGKKGRSYCPYYEHPNSNTYVKEWDLVEVVSGKHRGFQGIVATIGDGESSPVVKIWPTDETIEKFPTHPGIEDGSHKCWFDRPRLKLIKRYC